MRESRLQEKFFGIVISIASWAWAFWQCYRLKALSESGGTFWLSEFVSIIPQIVFAFIGLALLYPEQIEGEFGSVQPMAIFYFICQLGFWGMIVHDPKTSYMYAISGVVIHAVVAYEEWNDWKASQRTELWIEESEETIAEREEWHRQRKEEAVRPQHRAAECERVVTFYADNLDVLKDVTSLADLRERIVKELDVSQSSTTITAMADSIISDLGCKIAMIELQKRYDGVSQVIESTYPRTAFDSDVAEAQTSKKLFAQKVAAIQSLINRLVSKLKPVHDDDLRRREEKEARRQADEDRKRTTEAEAEESRRRRELDASIRATRRAQIERQVRAEAEGKGFSDDDIEDEILFRLNREEEL